MAVKDINEARGKQRKNALGNHTIVSVLITVLFLVLTVVTLFGYAIPNYIAAGEINSEVEEYCSDITALSEDSSRLAEELENKDELYERVAREDYGYCKQGEKVYYDSSFGE